MMPGCVRVTFTKVFSYVAKNETLLDGRRHRSSMPTVRQLSDLLGQLSLTAVTDDTMMDSHVSRPSCFRLVFRGNVRQYGEVRRVLWSAVQPRLAGLSYVDRDDFNASVVVAFNEEYIEPSEYADFHVDFDFDLT